LRIKTYCRTIGQTREEALALKHGLALVGFTGGLLAAAAGQAQEHKLRMAMLAIPMSNYTEAAKAVPARIEQATNGRVKVELYDSLIPGNQLHTAVRDGRVDISAIVNVYLSSEDPRITMSNLPGLVETVADYRKLHQAYWGAEMAKVWGEKYNSIPLTDGVWLPQMVLSRKPIRTLEDFKGLKIRVHNTEVAFLINAIGARSTPIAAGEMLQALDRGVVDAVITSPAVGFGLGFGDVAKHLQLWPFATQAGWTIVMNRNSWEKLPADVRGPIQQTMRELEEERYRKYDAYLAEILGKWKEKGVELYQVPKAEGERAHDTKYVKPVYEAWNKRLKDLGVNGEEILQKAHAALGR